MKNQECYLCKKELLPGYNSFECASRKYDYILCDKCSIKLAKELRKLKIKNENKNTH